ncbi:MAG TPA: hypothetical protein VF576_09410 [Rubricoccaceae bacterium]|jgi:hypothetical protein
MSLSDTPGEPSMAVLTRADLKLVIAEALRDNRDWIREVVQEALEECAGDEARREAEFRAALADPRVAFPPSEGHA